LNNATFVILSFEGPDVYSHAGGLGSRVAELSEELSRMGFETHLVFVGDPDLPPTQVVQGGRLYYHRWCQWISRHHPGGVYDGEDGKLWDWDRSLPPWLESEIIAPRVSAGGSVVVMAEEWHTAGTVGSLREIVTRRGWQDQVHLLWNANNTFSFYRINWEALNQAATITTVSRYMKHVMWGYGVDARVIPNGISESWLQTEAAQGLSEIAQERLTLAKVARWDPDKRWNMTVDAVADMKRRGLRPLLLARGGAESHKYEVLDRAAQLGLRTAQAYWEGGTVGRLLNALRPVVDADVVDLQGYLSQSQRKVLFNVADAVLANSGLEPFGLVGLETMSVGGLAFVGCTGEDYATHGYDAVSIQTSNPQEIVYHAASLKGSRSTTLRLRRAARRSAKRYTWPVVIRRALLPLLQELGLPEGDGVMDVGLPAEAEGMPAADSCSSGDGPQELPATESDDPGTSCQPRDVAWV
jgi:glycosyltransferase involved in cell wall biosynthesis